MNREEFGRFLTEFARSQADQRISRTVKQVDRGLVVSKYPLQIAPRRSVLDRIIYSAADVEVVSDIPLEQGQTVTIITTVTDNVVVMPVINGAELSLAPNASGTPGPAGVDPSNTTPLGVPAVGGPAGTRVINKALSYLGTKETGTNTDGGGKIDEWQARWGLSGQPWCGCFADAMFHEAGVDDEGFGDPYTGDITARAKAAGKHRNTNPVKGCFAVKGTQHVTLYIGGPIHQADCIGGNQSDAVTRVTYDLRGWDFAIPSALLEGATTQSTASPTGGSASGGSRPAMGPRDWL